MCADGSDVGGSRTMRPKHGDVRLAMTDAIVIPSRHLFTPEGDHRLEP